MRHLISIAFFIVAAAAYFFSVGPLFFGTPIMGWVLVLVGVACEFVFWRRVAKRKPGSSPSSPAVGK